MAGGTPQTSAKLTSEFNDKFFQPERVASYFDEARKRSSVMQQARRVPLGVNGQEIVYSTSKAQAAWVAEGAKKQTTERGMDLKSFKPAKIAAISVMSAEVARQDPANYVEQLRADVGEAFAVAFDNAVLHGTNAPGAFGGFIDQTSKAVEFGSTLPADGGLYGDIVAGLKLLVDDGKKLSGFAFDNIVEPAFLGAVDMNGRPLFVESTYSNDVSGIVPGKLIGRNAYLGDNLRTPIVPGTPNTGGIVGYGGDWSQVVWGMVGDITWDISDNTAVTLNGELVSLWENNLVAIRAEAELGIMINDVESFVKFTDHTSA